MNLVKLGLLLCVFLLGCKKPDSEAPPAPGPVPVLIGSSTLTAGADQEQLACDTTSCDVLIKSTLKVVGVTLNKQPEVLMFSQSEMDSLTDDSTCFGSLIPLTTAGSNQFEGRIKKPVDTDFQFDLQVDVKSEEFPSFIRVQSLRGKIKQGSQKVVFDYMIGVCPGLGAEHCPSNEAAGVEPVGGIHAPLAESPRKVINTNLPACN